MLLLQVDLQRKVEERNRLLAEYKVMEPLPWGFGWFFSSGNAIAVSPALGPPWECVAGARGVCNEVKGSDILCIPPTASDRSFIALVFGGGC